MPQRVLIIDDEPDIRELLEITLGRMNILTTAVGMLKEAREQLTKNVFDFCLTDMRLPDGDGLVLVSEIQAHFPQMPVAVITAHGSTETAITAMKAGAFDFLSKPVDLVKLRALVTSALKLAQTPAHEERPIAPEDAIIGNSRSILSLKQQIGKLARSQAPVFIGGESGSGKELTARAIHARGPRHEKEFVAINCGAIPSELMESEFFGHKKGSFTGADQDKIGLFQAANGGSLFLDEIADLPLHMQVKLLRAIQEKAIRPIGAQTEIAVDVRLLSASHRNLARAVEQGQMRQDLYYRINVIELQVPPLRERQEDIALLADHILNKLAQSNQMPPMTLSGSALEKLRQYSFPGNVRELENILQRACALAEKDEIEEEDLPDLDAAEHAVHAAAAAQPGTIAEPIAQTSPHTADDGSYSLEHHLETIERQAIEKALNETKWNRTAAAKKLGMSFRSFRYRLKKLGLD